VLTDRKNVDTKSKKRRYEGAVTGITTIRDLINLWPTRKTLVDDIRAAFPELPVSVSQVHKWAEKQSVPARYQHALVVVGQGRGFDVTADLIVQLHFDENRGAA
jgi:hypothetical protein